MPEADVEAACALAFKWKIHPTLAIKLFAMANVLPFPIQIFSGYRTAQEQKDAGATAAADELSTHRTCPATGADVRPVIARSDRVKLDMGRAAFEVGLRWGGGAPLDQNGIPVHPEWMHFDLGPRTAKQ